MNANGIVPVCIILVCGLVFCAGCMSSRSPDSTIAATLPTTLIETPVAPIATTAPPASLVSTPAGAASPTPGERPTLPVATTTWIQEPSVEEKATDPQILVLAFVRNYFKSDLPDCGMKASFPQVANEAGYGILQPVPRLTLLSEGQVLAFLEANAKPNVVVDGITPYVDQVIDPYMLGGSRCAGVPISPTWNVILINATLMPRNARPADYDIGINVRSQGRVVEQLRLNQTLIIDQPVIFAWFVPMKTEEMALFDSIELVFHKKK